MSSYPVFFKNLLLVLAVSTGLSSPHDLEDYVSEEHKITGYLSALGYSPKCVAQAMSECSEKSYCDNISLHDEEFHDLLVNMNSMIRDLQIKLDSWKTNILPHGTSQGEDNISTMPYEDKASTQPSTSSSTSDTTVPVWVSTPSSIVSSTSSSTSLAPPDSSVDPNLPVEVQYRPRNCADLFNRGDTTSGSRIIYPLPGVNSAAKVYCDQETRGGGWTVIQRRMPIENRENFTRNWCDYMTGFGNLSTEHWLGLELIHVLTTESRMMLHIDLEDWEGDQRYAEYSTFKVYNGSTNYLMTAAGFRGNVPNEFAYHSGSAFSTFDRDNDSDLRRHCARRLKSGFWFKKCHWVNLNGLPLEGNYNLYIAKGIVWRRWKGYRYSLKETQMMVRPSPWKLPYSPNL